MHDFFDLIKALAWPLVIAGALLGFRKSLSNFLKEVAGRATKLSITSIFAIELPLPEASHPQSDQFRLDLQKLAAGEEYISIVSILLDQVKKEKALDYMIADLGSGQRWLTSRLFIFAAILQRVRSLRCVVFLETRDGIKDRFLGITLPHEILLAFARQYSWLDEAYVKAYIQVDPNNVLLSTKPMYGVVDSNEASYFTLRFIASIQNPEAPVPDEVNQWVFLEKEQKWEHANWLDRSRLETDLGTTALRQQEDTWFTDSLDISEIERLRKTLRRKGAFVALVDKQGVFRGLIDREGLLEQVASRVGEVPDDQSSTKD